MTCWGRKSHEPQSLKRLGTFSRLLQEVFKVLCLYACVYIHVIAVTTETRRGRHLQDDVTGRWEWTNQPVAGGLTPIFCPSSMFSLPPSHLSSFWKCLFYFIFVSRVLAYHSSCVKVRGQLLGVSSLLLPWVSDIELRLSGTWQESMYTCWTILKALDINI